MRRRRSGARAATPPARCGPQAADLARHRRPAASRSSAKTWSPGRRGRPPPAASRRSRGRSRSSTSVTPPARAFAAAAASLAGPVRPRWPSRRRAAAAWRRPVAPARRASCTPRSRPADRLVIPLVAIAAMRLDRGLSPSPSGPAGTTISTTLSNATRPKESLRLEPVDQLQQRAPRGLQALAGHRAAAVEHHLHAARQALAARRRVRGDRSSSIRVTWSACSTATRSTSSCASMCMHLSSWVVLDGGSAPAGRL